MTKNYEKTVDELNEYNAENKLFVGIDVLKNEDVFFDLNNVDNIMLSGVAGTGKTILLKSLLYQLTNKQKTMNNLFIIEQHIADYMYFIDKGAQASSTYDVEEMNIDNVLEAAYANFKQGKPTIFVVEHFDTIQRYTKKDLKCMLTEMLDSENAIVIAVNHRFSSLTKMFNTNFKLQKYPDYSEEIGTCLLDGKLIKPPYVRFKR